MNRMQKDSKNLFSSCSAADPWLFPDPAGEREEVHAALGQPEGQRCGEELHVQQAHVCHLQHGAAVKHRSLARFLGLTAGLNALLLSEEITEARENNN